MALVARIVPAHGGRIIAKRLRKDGGKLAIPDGAVLEIVDGETGAHVRAQSARPSDQGLLLKFATPEGDVALELTGAIAGLAEALSDVSADAAATAGADAEEAGAEAQSNDTAATGPAESGDADRGGFSPVLLGILGLGALGGIAAAVSGGGEDKDVTAPVAPTALDLADADDSGVSASDGITRNGSGLTISGKAEPQARVELFDGATSLGTATADASGNFTLDVALGQGVHSITARATDAAGNIGPASAALSITVDSTAPTAAIALSRTALAEGETATVTITFSEPVSGFDKSDLTVESGTIDALVSTDGGRTWTGTFTPTDDVTDLTNVITLGTGYTDIAGNAGTAAASANYSVETLTFVVSDEEDGTVDFGGTATGPISITLNASDEALFSRGGKEAEAVIGSISTKTMNVPVGGELAIAIDGEATTDSFTLDAPNAATLVFTGNGGALDDSLNIIIQSATANADLRTLKIDTSGLTGVETIRFVFPEDARDVVRLTADSKLTGFSTIEVSKGGVDLTAVNVQPGVEFIVNSTLIVTLAQFRDLSSIVSVTGLGKLTLNLTAEEVQSDALAAFLASNADKPLLIGTTVTVHGPDNAVLPVPPALDAISYDSIPALSDRVDALEARVDDLGIDDIAGLGTTLTELNDAITLLQSVTGRDGPFAAQIRALEGKLDGIADTVVAYVDAQIAAVQTRIDGLDTGDIAGLGDVIDDLNAAITALQASSDGLGGLVGQPADAGAVPPVPATGLYLRIEQAIAAATSAFDAQIADLQDQLGNLGLDDIAGLEDALGALGEAIAALGELTGEGSVLDERISALEALIAQINIDTDAPTIVDIQLSSATGADADGRLDAGDVVIATVSLSEAVLVAGQPTLALIIGDGEDARIVHATLVGGAGTDRLTFSYTITAEDQDLTGIGIGENALILGDGVRISDRAGNALDPLFAGTPDNGGFVIDNSPLILSASVNGIFGGAGVAIVGILVTESGGFVGEVLTSDLDAGNRFVVPEGTRFLSMDEYLAVQFDEVEAGDMEWLLAHSLPSGSLFTVDFEGSVVLDTFAPLLVNEEILRGWLEIYADREGWPAGVETVDEFIATYTSSYDPSMAGAEIQPEFLERIVGRDPAGVELEVTGALTVAQAAALAAAGFDLSDHVVYSIRDSYTTVQAALSNPAQKAALEHAGQVISRGDELDNVVSMTAFTSAIKLRSELGAGNDVYNAGRGHEEIVGQSGGDTINLTYNDNSRDVVTYQSVFDGRTASVTDLRYSTDEDDYRAGSEITVTINGHVYAYTTGEEGETPEAALQKLADAVMAKQVGDGERVVIGLRFMFVQGRLEQDGFVYQDKMTSGAYTVPSGQYFLSATNYLLMLASGDDSDQQIYNLGLSGGQTFRSTDEAYLAIDDDYIDQAEGFMSLVEGQTILADADAYQQFLENYPYLEPLNWLGVEQAIADATRYRDVTAVTLDEDSGTLTFTGATFSRDTAIEAGHEQGHEDQDAIDNPGQPASVSITFLADAEDYPALTNGDHSSTFDRELRVTINGLTITANLVPSDPEASVEALRVAVIGAMIDGATTAIKAAYSTVDLGGALTESSTLGSYALTLTVNGVAVTLEGDDGVTLADLIAAIRAVGGVESVAFDGQNLVVTGEVRGTDAAQNSVSITGFTIGETDYVAVDTAAVGQSLSGLISNVSRDGIELTFTGFVPATDDDAPTFEVERGEIDRSGVQQEVLLNFSTNNADYYEGGSLRVTINGIEVEAHMVAGSAYQSMEALVDKINAIVGQSGNEAMLVEQAILDPIPSIVPGLAQIRLVSSVERPDALQLTKIQQDYRGEEQTATITLEDALTYTAQSGQDALTADRFADVYFEGGKVYATFVPRVSDGNGGLTDGTPVTVSADMVVEAGSSSYLGSSSFSASDYLGLLALSITIDGHLYDRADFEAYLADIGRVLATSLIEPGNAARVSDLTDWIATLDGVASVVPGEMANFVVTYETGVTGAIDALQGGIYTEIAGQLILGHITEPQDISNVPGGGDPEATAQALADAINAAAQQVVHFAFDMGEPPIDPVTRDTTLVAGPQSSKIDMLVSIDGFGNAILAAGSDYPAMDTVGELLDWLNGLYEGHGVWSLNADGDGLELRTASDALVVVGEAPHIGLVGHDLGFERTTTDPALLPFIGHAEADGAGITVTAAEVGKDMFSISGVTLDYEGVHQIATVSFAEFGNYYEGGTLFVEIDTTPGEDGGIVRIQANMVDGDRDASLRNLIDEIRSHTQTGATAAQIVLPGDEGLLAHGLNNADGLPAGFYISSWSITVGTGDDVHSYSGRGEAVTVGGTTQWSALGGESVFDSLADFLDYLSGLEGVGSASLDAAGNLVITSANEGDDAYISAAFDIRTDPTDADSDALIAGIRSDYGSAGALVGEIGDVVLGENGTITLVSAVATREEFTITDAEMTREPVRQEADARYSTEGVRYYAGGKIGMTVNGVTVETDMLVEPATSRLWASSYNSGTGQLFQNFSPENYIGSVLPYGDSFAFSITIDGQTHTEAEFIAYLLVIDPTLAIPTTEYFTDPAPTLQHLADWIEQLAGVDNVQFSLNAGMTVTYQQGVHGQIDAIAGQIFSTSQNAIGANLADGVSPDNNPGGSGDAEATLEALRDAIWQQVTHATLVIDIGPQWSEASLLTFWGMTSANGNVAAQGPSDTVGDFLAGLETVQGIESVRFVNGQIIIMAEPGQAPLDMIINADFVPDGVHAYHLGNALYGAFASVDVSEGHIDFVAADAVDGYGEIDISDVFMSVAAQAQITQADFDEADFALGLVDDDGNRGKVSISIAGQTITSTIEDSYSGTVRGLAQAIIEARDGTFETETVSTGRGDLPAVAYVDLPAGVDGDSRLMCDPAGHSSDLAFVVRFSEGGSPFVLDVPEYYSVSVTELVDILNQSLEAWAGEQEPALPLETLGSFAYDATENRIVVQSHGTGSNAYVEISTATLAGFWEDDGTNIQFEGADAKLGFSSTETKPVDGSGEDRTSIDLPPGVTFGSLIRGVPGGDFPGAEASIEIEIRFDVHDRNVIFSALTSLDYSMTVGEAIGQLNFALEMFALDNETGPLGSFSLEHDGKVIFIPDDSNGALASYSIPAFNISAFGEATPIPASDVMVDHEVSHGASQALVIAREDGSIALDDPIGMDPVEISLTIDGQVHEAVFLPKLTEKPGERSATVGDFLEWVEMTFDDIEASIVDGRIVFRPTSDNDLSAGTVSLDLLDASRTMSSAPVGETMGEITLTEFEGLDGDARLVGRDIDFEIYVGDGSTGELLSFSYHITPTSTVSDLLAYIESHAARPNGQPVLFASLDESGIAIELSHVGIEDRLWVSGLSLSYEAERTGVNAALAAVLGEVDFDGSDDINLHGKNTGPDALDVGGLSYDSVDQENSVHQKVVVAFDNLKLDNATDGSVVSLTILGQTTSITINTSGEPGQGELDLRSVTPNGARSSVILDALIQRLYEAHQGDAVGSIVRGYVDDEGAFHADSGVSSTVLHISADVYGQQALGTPQDDSAMPAVPAVKATIVNAAQVEQFSLLAVEFEAGKVSFEGSGRGVDIHDGTDGDEGRVGRNESIIHYHDDGGPFGDGTYVLDDITDDAPGVTLSWDEDDEFSYLDSDNDDARGVSPGVIDQHYVNAGSSGDNMNPGYYGEGPRSGANGVQQTHQNPGGSYTATDGSPAANGGNVSTGDDDLHGGAAGYYDEEGLHTDHIDGETAVPDGEGGGSHYEQGETGSTTVVEGVDHGQASDADGADDGFHVDVIRDGFAAFTWDDAIHQVTTHASRNADVVNNFQVAHDVINIEGALETSTAAGEVDWIVADERIYSRSAGTTFDLDLNEFGIVTHDANRQMSGAVNADNLSDAEDIATLLSRVFDLTADGEDDVLNTTIFAVTAEDDPNATAIWVHSQSSVGDNTISANELTLLAIVHATGGDFGANNLQMLQYQYEGPPLP